MDETQTLADRIRSSSSPLLGPLPLAHSQELAEGLPPVRRRVGPRPWYECVDPPRPEGRSTKNS